MSAIQQMIMAAYGSAIWTPATLFAASEQGVWYDPSDFSTLFQDSGGTTPVTAVGQPVGLLLDKSKGLVLGPELVTNGDFSNGATGWTLTSATVNAGALDCSGPAWTGFASQATADFSASYLEVSFTVSNYVSGSVTVTGAQSYVSANGTYTQRKSFAGYAATAVISSGGAGFVGTVDNVSIKVISGNHATQATAAARPVLATGIDLDGVDDTMAQSAGGGSTTSFMLCAAVKPEGGAASARTIWSDAGTNTGYIVRLNASNQLEMSVGNGTAYTTIATTATVDVGTAYVVTAWDDGTNLNVQVNNGTVASVARPTVSAGTATATLGKNNGAATGFFNGTLISVVQVKNDGGTAAERSAAKAYAARKGGVTL